ncbi:hypothetical protein [Phytohabitans houttuyneae]|nr:hypothetical protein [Phytohabitans houttuyneae]
MTVRQLLQHTSGIYNYTSDLPGLASPEGTWSTASRTSTRRSSWRSR